MVTWKGGLLLVILGLLLLALAILFRRFLMETWWFLTRKPFGKLVEDLAQWHHEQGIPFTKGEIDALYVWVKRAPDMVAECAAVRRELQMKAMDNDDWDDEG